MILFQIFFWLWPSLAFVEQLSRSLSVWLRMLNVIFTTSHRLDQITLTMRAAALHFQWSINSIFIKKPFKIKVLVCFSLCLSVYKWHNNSSFLFGYIWQIYIKKLLLRLKMELVFPHYKCLVIQNQSVLFHSQLMGVPCGFRFGGKGSLAVASWPHTPLLHKRQN